MNWTTFKRLRPIYLPQWTTRTSSNSNLCLISNNIPRKRLTKLIPMKLTRIRRDRIWKRIRQSFWSTKNNNTNKKLKIMGKRRILRLKMLVLKDISGNLCREMQKGCTTLGPRWEFKIQRDLNRNFWGISKRNRLKYLLRLMMLNRYRHFKKIRVNLRFRRIK